MLKISHATVLWWVKRHTNYESQSTEEQQNLSSVKSKLNKDNLRKAHVWREWVIRKESENCDIRGIKQITCYSRTFSVPQKIPKDLEHNCSSAVTSSWKSTSMVKARCIHWMTTQRPLKPVAVCRDTTVAFALLPLYLYSSSSWAERASRKSKHMLLTEITRNKT